MTDKAVPKYRQLKQEIMTWLESGQLKQGEQMPSEHEIAAKFAMSRQTVRQTLGELEQEGWLYRVQGKGTFVSPQRGAGGGARPELQTVGMITTYISDYIFPHIVRGAESALRGKGYGLLLSSTDNDKDKETDSLTMMLSQPIAGLIVEPTRSALGNPNLHHYLTLQYRGIPVVMINERYPELGVPCVKLDDELGGFLAAEHLIRLGHRRIAGFFKADDLQGVNRLRGFLRAHRQYEVPLEPAAVVHYHTGEKRTKPYEAALAMLRQEQRPTAVVCYNDELAVTLLEAVRQAGLHVPRDLSVVGFDDSPLATATEIKLTTLSHPKTELGVKAVETLAALMAGGPGAASDTVYAPELIVRESTQAYGQP
ncbi:GntR family transcriptional regulator [Gordoniibacillus kamchatkensis]|uniref:GntR family transcriptional regulator n=1 Tax=Gordoniibacillus kamchatkensis TaxID=1590651 RepID=A0ABR5AN57_9BACL|nr:GntR family transcriptional regulator [Paenibacillus sp. VKM B-2647]KIL42439.1 GntR family transcriptional regulator [Paenibacillus sp. VKM B-2647]